jgi:hypothetical protein
LNPATSVPDICTLIFFNPLIFHCLNGPPCGSSSCDTDSFRPVNACQDLPDRSLFNSTLCSFVTRIAPRTAMPRQHEDSGAATVATLEDAEFVWRCAQLFSDSLLIQKF